MTHKLRLIILQHLSKRPLAGYGLIKEIFDATGWKPSYGSVYPILEHMHKEGLVTFKQEGKRKTYLITAKGKAALQEFRQQHSLMVEQIHGVQKVLMHLCNVKQDPFFDRISEGLERGQIPFHQVLKQGHGLRSELARLAQQGLLDTRKEEVIKILEDATRQLRSIKKPGARRERAA
jgi:DNA-binding PadR family transcriptional regulator